MSFGITQCYLPPDRGDSPDLLLGLRLMLMNLLSELGLAFFIAIDRVYKYGEQETSLP